MKLYSKIITLILVGLLLQSACCRWRSIWFGLRAFESQWDQKTAEQLKQENSHDIWAHEGDYTPPASRP